MKRVVTVVVEFEKKSPPSWIWDAHASGQEQNGVKVIGIANGDLIEEIEERDLAEISGDDE